MIQYITSMALQTVLKWLQGALKIIGLGKRYHDEMRAAESGSTAPINPAQQLITGLLDQLTINDGHQSRARELLNELKNRVIGVSEQFEVTAIQDWLRDAQVRDVLKVVLKRSIADRTTHESIPAIIYEKYEHYTGERKELAAGHVQTIIAILHNRITTSLNRDSATMASTAILQAGQKEIVEEVQSGYRNLKEMLNVQTSTSPAFRRFSEETNSECVREYQVLLTRRELNDENVHIHAKRAVERLGSDWIAVDLTNKINILTLAAIVHCDSIDLLSFAKECLQAILTLDHDADTSRIQAGIDFCEGRHAEAMKLLHSIDSPDARSQMLIYLLKSQGDDAVLQWLATVDLASSWDILTYVGWHIVGLVYAKAHRWEEALKIIDGYASESGNGHAKIIGLRALLSVGMLLPSDYRDPDELSPLMLSYDVYFDTTEARRFRDQAVADFLEYENIAQKHNVADEVYQARTWRVCLMLSDTGRREQGLQLFHESFVDTDFAWALLPVAVQFEIGVSTESLRGDLQRRRLIGEFGSEERRKHLLILWYERDYESIVNLLDSDIGVSLLASSDARTFVSILIESCIRVHEVDRAEKILAAHRGTLGGDASRFDLMIQQGKGEDIQEEVAALYESTKSDTDLLNLCDYLWKAKEYTRLRAYATEYFERHRNQTSLNRLVQCLLALHQDEEIVKLYEAYDPLFAGSAELQFAYARSLYYLGRPFEAQRVLDGPLGDSPSLSVALLSINIALHTGDRIKALRLIESEATGARISSPSDILQLANISARLDRSTAHSLLIRAVEAEPNDAHILAGAGWIAIKIGFDEDGISWIHRAAAHSTSDGPIRRYTMKETIEMYLDRGKRSETLDTMLVKGEIPLHVYCSGKNIPLSMYLVALARRNQTQIDARQKPLVTIRHGSRGVVDLSSVRTITMDVTALLTSEAFDIMRHVTKSFDKVLIPWGTLALLLMEEHKTEFHQPSRIKNAQAILGDINQGLVQILSPSEEPPSWLVKEIGVEDAVLLTHAKHTRGIFVGHLPKHRLGSLEFDDADLKEYDVVTVTPTELVQYLHQVGSLADAETEGAVQKLKAAGFPIRRDLVDLPTGPWYLDGLSLDALHNCGLIARLSALSKLVIHADSQRELASYVAFDESSQYVRETLARLQAQIRSGLLNGRIEYLPHVTLDEAVENDPYDLMSLMTRIGCTDALWIDDRAVGSLPVCIDAFGAKAPTVGIVDILDELHNRSVITNSQFYTYLVQLRQSNMVVLALSKSEVEYWLDRARVNSGVLVETAELGTIRRYYNRILALTLLQLPDESTFLNGVRILMVDLIAKYWKDPSVPVDVAMAKSSWLLMSLPIAIRSHQHLMQKPSDRDSAVRDKSIDILVLINIIVELPRERREMYSQWLENVVIAMVGTSNSNVIDDVAQFLKETLRTNYEKH